MAKIAGSGQGRVRTYRTGRMHRCLDEGCQRAIRAIGFKPGEFSWRCGQAPLLAKTRVGQQKQAKR